MSTREDRARPAGPAGIAGYRPFGAFRLALAGLVLAQHGLLLLPPAQKKIFYELELGAVAVTCFFALSGFIVAEALSSFYHRRPLAFLANRLLRLLPPYLLALAITIVVQSLLFAKGWLVPLDAPLLGAPWQPRVILAALCEIVPGLPSWRISGEHFSFIPFAWTLRVEFAFYLAAFATCVAGDRLEGRGGVRRRRVVGLAIAASYAAFARFLWHHDVGPQQILCVPFFAFGLLCFFCRHRPGAFNALHLLSLAVFVPLAFTYWGQKGHPVLAFQLPCLCFLFAIFYGLTRIGQVPASLRRLDKMCGDLSYPLYIGHGVVVVALLSLANRRGWALYAVCIAGSFLLAILLHKLAEMPLRGLRDRLRGRPV